jgi:PD-(D/E)XK nuclease superfamily
VMGTLTAILSEAKEARNESLPAKEIIEKIYSGYMEEDNWKQKKSFSPSGLFYMNGKCARRWVLSFQGNYYESKATSSNFANMKSGIKAHERIQEAMQNAGITNSIEHKVELDDPPILGYADGVIIHNDERYVAEIKTTSSRNFEYRVLTNKIADYHMGQILIYMVILGVTKGIIIYENRDTNKLHGITIDMTPEYAQYILDVLQWCREVWAMYKSDDLPIRSFRKDSKVCKSCPVEIACDESPVGKTAIRRLIEL